jgi:hypothetical protein
MILSIDFILPAEQPFQELTLVDLFHLPYGSFVKTISPEAFSTRPHVAKWVLWLMQKVAAHHRSSDGSKTWKVGHPGWLSRMPYRFLNWLPMTWAYIIVRNFCNQGKYYLIQVKPEIMYFLDGVFCKSWPFSLMKYSLSPKVSGTATTVNTSVKNVVFQSKSEECHYQAWCAIFIPFIV